MLVDQLDNPDQVLLVFLDGGQDTFMLVGFKDLFRHAAPEHAAGGLVAPDLGHANGDDNAGAVVQRLAIEAEFLRSEEHTSELQSLMRISYAVFCLKKTIAEYSQFTPKEYTI